SPLLTESPVASLQTATEFRFGPNPSAPDARGSAALGPRRGRWSLVSVAALHTATGQRSHLVPRALVAAGSPPESGSPLFTAIPVPPLQPATDFRFGPNPSAPDARGSAALGPRRGRWSLVSVAALHTATEQRSGLAPHAPDAAGSPRKSGSPLFTEVLS